MMLLSITAIVLQMAQNSESDNLMQKISAYPSHFVNIINYFSYVAYNSMVMSVLVFCIIIRILRILLVSRKVSVILRAISVLKKAVLSFIPLFFVILFAFSTLFTLLFETRLSQFNSLGRTMMTLFFYAFFPRMIHYFNYKYSFLTSLLLLAYSIIICTLKPFLPICHLVP